MISLRNVSLQTRQRCGFWRHRSHSLLSHLTFDIPAGEVTLLAGASGCGKTLLARAILNVLPQDVKLSGRIVAPSQLAYLPQAISHLDPTATIGRQIRRSHGKHPVLPAQLAPRYPHQLSGGEAKRALIAMMPEAEAIIADEPTAGLDPDTAAEVIGLLAQKAAKGAAVLVITHDLAASLPSCNRLVLLQDTSVAAIHPATDFADPAHLSPAACAFWRAMPQNGFHHD